MQYTSPTLADIRAKGDEIRHNAVVKRPLKHARHAIVENQWQSYLSTPTQGGFNSPFANLKAR